MIDTPTITQSPALLTAAIRLTIPRSQIQHVMGPAIGEVMQAVAKQGLAPAGPVFSYHFKMDPNTFDFDVGVPVKTAIKPAGRVKPGTIPAAKVARTIYRGPYENLGAAWGEFMKWIDAQKLKPAPTLWEFYTAGPESGPDPANWRTELNRPLLG